MRGRTLACAGPAATSTGMAVVAAAVAGGAWLAVVDVPTFGLDAASEVGIALERVVAVSVTSPAADDPITSGANGASGAASWVEVMAAVVDGFDIVLARVPADAPAGPAAPIGHPHQAARCRGRSSLDDSSGAMPCDGVIDIRRHRLGRASVPGSAHLQQRTVELHLSGRRVPGRRQCRVTLPAVTVAARCRRAHPDPMSPMSAPLRTGVCASDVCARLDDATDRHRVVPRLAGHGRGVRPRRAGGGDGGQPGGRPDRRRPPPKGWSSGNDGARPRRAAPTSCSSTRTVPATPASSSRSSGPSPNCHRVST